MRKYFIGAIAGAVLMFGFQAAASGTLTGSKVQGEKTVKLNGKEVGSAAIINGSSYLPVRSISESMGMNIDLSGGTINLSDTNSTSPTTDTSSSAGSTGTSTPSKYDPNYYDFTDNQQLRELYAQYNKVLDDLAVIDKQLNDYNKELDAYATEVANGVTPERQAEIDAARKVINDQEEPYLEKRKELVPLRDSLWDQITDLKDSLGQ